MRQPGDALDGRPRLKMSRDQAAGRRSSFPLDVLAPDALGLNVEAVAGSIWMTST
jgi:hypothetical protein